MLKRYLVLSVVTAAFSLPSLVYAAQQNILSVHILNQQTGKPAADVTVTLEKKADKGTVARANCDYWRLPCRI